MRTRNDLADRDPDAAPASERPVLPGAISASTALAVATGRAAAGLDLAAAAGPGIMPAAAPPRAGLVGRALGREVSST